MAVERMEKLQHAVSKETMQLMRAKEICLEQRKHSLREEVGEQGLETITQKPLEHMTEYTRTHDIEYMTQNTTHRTH